MNRTPAKFSYLTILIAIVLSGAASVRPQAAPQPEKPAARRSRPVATVPPMPRRLPRAVVVNGPGQTSEKSLAVDPRVSITMCVTQGNLKINGWQRSEVRIFVKDGSPVSFKVRQKSRQDEKPVWIAISSFDRAANMPPSPNECIWGEDIEMDVPVGAEMNISGRETRTVIDSIRKASVKTAGGDVTLRNVAEGINALNLEGDITVENSGGAVSLETTTGNIVAFDTGPSDVGDVFKAKTNSGAIALQNVDHRQIEANSISGTVQYNGELLNGGLYSFGTSNGAISLSVPAGAPCFLSATYGYGNFNSEIPVKLYTENVAPGAIKTVKGIFGEGDCKLNLTTTSGVIRIKKPEQN